MENIPNQFLGLSNSIEKFRAFASILEEKIEDKVGGGGRRKLTLYTLEFGIIGPLSLRSGRQKNVKRTS